LPKNTSTVIHGRHSRRCPHTSGRSLSTADSDTPRSSCSVAGCGTVGEELPIAGADRVARLEQVPARQAPEPRSPPRFAAASRVPGGTRAPVPGPGQRPAHNSPRPHRLGVCGGVLPRRPPARQRRLEGLVRLRDPATGQHGIVEGRTGWVRAVAFSPDGPPARQRRLGGPRAPVGYAGLR
jgi:hypothetical protein